MGRQEENEIREEIFLIIIPNILYHKLGDSDTWMFGVGHFTLFMSKMFLDKQKTKQKQRLMQFLLPEKTGFNSGSFTYELCYVEQITELS